ncbi:hypothetical protein ACQPZJ_01580 [Actinoplanes sp. CA-054009]
MLPTAKLLTTLAAAAWVTATTALVLNLFQLLPLAPLVFLLACAIALTHRAGLEKNGTDQVLMAFDHGRQVGAAAERARANQPTMAFPSRMPTSASARARLQHLPGQRPIH